MRKGQKVQVRYTTGAEDENYTGPAVFVRHIRKTEIGYDYLLKEEPHCMVRVSKTDCGSVFPTRYVKGFPA